MEKEEEEKLESFFCTAYEFLPQLSHIGAVDFFVYTPYSNCVMNRYPNMRVGSLEGTYIFSDSSLLESRNIGGGAFIVGSRGEGVEVESGIGNVVMVWDGEVASMASGLVRVR